MSTYLSPQQMPWAVNYPELTFGSSEPDTTLPPPRDHHGCFACRWRKKKCMFNPLDNQTCRNCAKFNIRCFGNGLERPTGKLLAMTVRAELGKWIGDRSNRAPGHLSFDLSPYCLQPVQYPTPMPIIPVTTAIATPPHGHHRDASPPAFNRPVNDNNHGNNSVIHQEPHAYNNTASHAFNGDSWNSPIGMRQPSPAWFGASDFSPQTPDSYSSSHLGAGSVANYAESSLSGRSYSPHDGFHLSNYSFDQPMVNTPEFYASAQPWGSS